MLNENLNVEGSFIPRVLSRSEDKQGVPMVMIMKPY